MFHEVYIIFMYLIGILLLNVLNYNVNLEHTVSLMSEIMVSLGLNEPFEWSDCII